MEVMFHVMLLPFCDSVWSLHLKNSILKRNGTPYVATCKILGYSQAPRISTRIGIQHLFHTGLLLESGWEVEESPKTCRWRHCTVVAGEKLSVEPSMFKSRCSTQQHYHIQVELNTGHLKVLC